MTPDAAKACLTSPGPGADAVHALLAEVATILLANGQTSEGTRLALIRLGRKFGHDVQVSIAWGVTTIQLVGGRGVQSVFTEPSGVDIGRVIAAETIVDAVCGGRMAVSDAQSALLAVPGRSPVSLLRFAIMAAAGAAALGVVFGAKDVATLGLITLIAGAGACLRRALSHLSGNPFLQPFSAALLSGACAGAAMLLDLGVVHRLVAACPCMVLVPGPHFLNGAIDLVRGRLPIGLSRLAFAALVVLAICAGLLIGLALTGTTFPTAGPTRAVPLVLDVVSAGVAVAAYGSFFNMPWRTLPILIGVGMVAHAVRWASLAAGASVPLGALAACLLVGSLITPLSDRRKLPFGACAFACVVSLVPGVFMFQAASDAVALTGLGSAAPPSMLVDLLGNIATAGLVVIAMGAGLIVPKMTLNRLSQQPN